MAARWNQLMASVGKQAAPGWNESPETCPVCGSGEDEDYWMLCCDQCDQWYHGQCADAWMVRREDAEYYCQPCRFEKNLAIIYRDATKQAEKRRKPTDATKNRKKKAAKKAKVEGGSAASSKSASKKKAKASTAPTKKRLKQQKSKVSTPHAAGVGADFANQGSAVEVETPAGGEDDEEGQEQDRSGPLPAYPRRPCALEKCGAMHFRRSKYCSEKCGMINAKLCFNTFKKQQQLHDFNGSIAGGFITRSDADDLAEFSQIQAKMKELGQQAHLLGTRRETFEAAVLENAAILVSEETIDQPAEKAAADGAADVFDCQCCGKQFSAASFAKHSEKCFMRVSGAATKRKKHPRQICGYQLPGKSEKCMVGWKVCGKHFNWEGQKDMEFRNEEYALHQAEGSLQKAQEAIRIRMQRRLDQFMSGETRGHTRAVVPTAMNK